MCIRPRHHLKHSVLKSANMSHFLPHYEFANLQQSQIKKIITVVVLISLQFDKRRINIVKFLDNKHPEGVSGKKNTFGFC